MQEVAKVVTFQDHNAEFEAGFVVREDLHKREFAVHEYRVDGGQASYFTGHYFTHRPGDVDRATAYTNALQNMVRRASEHTHEMNQL